MWMPHCQMTTTPRTHTHMHQCGQPPVTDFQFICLDAAKSTQHNDPFDRIVNRELHYFSLLFFVALRTLPEQLWQIGCVDRRPQPDLMQEERERAKKQEKHSAYASILIPFIGCVSNRNGDVFIAFLHFHMFFFFFQSLYVIQSAAWQWQWKQQKTKTHELLHALTRESERWWNAYQELIIYSYFFQFSVAACS